MSQELLSRLVLRWSFAVLFFWFGLQQLLDAGDWVAFLPEFTGYLPIPGDTLVQLNGWVELCFATALLFGYRVRIISALLAVHLFGIALTVDGATGVRDAVLGSIGVVLALSSADEWTIDAYFKRRATSPA